MIPDKPVTVILSQQWLENYLFKHTTMHRRCCKETAEGMMKELQSDRSAEDEG